MKAIIKSVLGGTLLVLAGATSVFAHAHLSKATPAVGSTVATAPREVLLIFSEAIEKSFSIMQVLDAKGARVDAGMPQISRETMRIPLKTIGAGTYKVVWKVLSVDTHRTEGNFSFTVKP